MDTIKIKLVRSPIGRIAKHKRTAKALGLTKVGKVVEKPDTPEIRGMVKAIDFMVEVEDEK